MRSSSDRPLEPDDPRERAAVRAGWADIAVLEELREGPARRIFATRWDAERARAAAWYSPVEGGPQLGSYRAMYESPSNLARFRRTLDLVLPGDDIVEIGTGKGFLASLLLRDGKAKRYRGGELLPDFVAATRQTLDVGGFSSRAQVRELDLYTLTADDTKGADLVVCCEVIEHLPDPEGALKVLADALPRKGELLFSTPLLGRLEGIWGHTAIFGVERLRSMLAQAGLIAHHVEAVDNTWVLVLASRRREVSRRATAAADALSDPTADLARDPLRPRAVTNKEPATMSKAPTMWNKRMDLHREQITTLDDDHGSVRGTRVTGTPRPDKTGPQYVGFSYVVPKHVQPVLGARLQLDLPHPEQVERISVEFLDGEDRALARWSWQPGESMPKDPRPTFVLREGARGHYFTPAPLDGDIRDATRVEVYASVVKGSDIDLSLVRWAWIH